MKAILTITKKELNTFFDSLIAYILLVVYLGVSGFFTWVYGNDIFMRGETSLDIFFDVFSFPNITLFVIIPALTMRLISEEKRSGTIELLLTKAVTDRQVVLGKFLATLILIIIALLLTSPYVITLANIGNLDQGAVIGGYFAIICMSAAFISIGLFASSITSNQIVAFLLALLLILTIYILFFVISMYTTGSLGTFFHTLSIPAHFESLSRGVIDTADIIYFLSIVVTGLVLSEMSLTKRKVSNA